MAKKDKDESPKPDPQELVETGKYSDPTYPARMEAQHVHRASEVEAAATSMAEVACECGLASRFSVPRPTSWPKVLCGGCGKELKA